VVGPQFSDLFWPVACGLWDFFFFKAAGGTRVQAVILAYFIFKVRRASFWEKAHF
jgi:hypothetical protein